MSSKIQRKQPNAEKYEFIVLGCMLNSINALNVGIDMLIDSDFYFSENRTIFKLMKKLRDADGPVEYFTLKVEIEDSELTNKPHLLSYIDQLSVVYNYTDSFISYCLEIKNKASKRGLLAIYQKAIEDILQDEVPIEDIFEQCSKESTKVICSVSSKGDVQLKNLFDGSLHPEKMPFSIELQNRMENYHKNPMKAEIPGIRTGYHDLDRVTGGFSPGQMVVIGARPGVGKSAFAVNLMLGVIKQEKIPVLLFTLEMSNKEVGQRVLSMTSSVPTRNIITGNITSDEYHQLIQASSEFNDMSFFIEDKEALPINVLKSIARRKRALHGVEMIVVDYIGLLDGTMRAGFNECRQVIISEISRGLKSLAMELQIPVIVLAQLNRNIEGREKSEPMLSDLRDSGSIEQDADTIIFLQRRDMIDPTDKPGQCQVFIKKNRSGELGLISLAFEKNFTRFTNIQWGPLPGENQDDFIRE